MGHIVHPDGTIKVSAPSLFTQFASVAHPDNHPIFGRIEKDEDSAECSMCRKSEKKWWLFDHPAQKNVCQDCLTKVIEADIEAEGKSEFEGFEFRRRAWGMTEFEADGQ